MNRAWPYGPFPPPGEAPDPSGAYQNPAGWLPFPAPTSTPNTGWFGGQEPLFWQGTPAGDTMQGSTYRWAVWRSPTFDLRPEFRSVPNTNNEPRSGEQMIWKAGGGQLYVWLHFGAGTQTLVDLNIVSYDEAHPFNSANLLPITAEQDVTSTFTSTNQTGQGFVPPLANRGMSGLGVFAPPGSGAAVRYWRLNLVLRFFIPHNDPISAITAAYY